MKEEVAMNKNISFTPKHWRQTDDGSFVLSPQIGYAPMSAVLLSLSSNDPSQHESIEEMNRIINEGGKVIVFDLKGDFSSNPFSLKP